MENVVKLRVNMGYLTVFETLFAILLIIISTLPFTFEPSNSPIYDLMWFLFFLFLATIFIRMVICGYQTVALDENGAVIRSLIGKIAEIRWQDIVKVDIRPLTTLTSHAGDFDVTWIIIYTAHDQEPKDGHRNKKNKPPWKIIYNKKNAETINGFLKRCTKIKSKIR